MMKNLRVINKGNKKKKQQQQCLVKILPKDMLVEIMGKVASHSTKQLYNIKLTCKEFLDAAEEDFVFQHASFDVLSLSPLPWFKRQEELLFLEQCKKMGNLEILYRNGMVEYFTSGNGIDSLKKAALEGHHDAKYVYSMVLFSSDDEQERSSGLDIFRSLKKATCIITCRKRVKGLMSSMWIKNPVVVYPGRLSVCCSSMCDMMVRTTGWSSLDEDYDVGVSCEYCCLDLEFGLFPKKFGV